MSQSATLVHVGRDVSLYSPDDEPVECITLWLWNTTPLSVRLLLAADEWDHIQSTGFFNSGELDLPADFAPVDSCLLDLDAVEASLPTDRRTIKKRFADPDSALRSTDAWSATGVRDHESTTSEDPADAPRVNDVGISMQQSRPAADPDGASTAADETVYEGLTNTLARVATDLAAENRPFEDSEDGTSLSLTATVDHATWGVIIDESTNTERSGADPDDYSPCLIRSIFPDRLGETRREALQPELDAYTETLNRGGFVVDGTGRVEFRTPFDPQAESTSDALAENVTALAEWFDRLAA